MPPDLDQAIRLSVSRAVRDCGAVGAEWEAEEPIASDLVRIGVRSCNDLPFIEVRDIDDRPFITTVMLRRISSRRADADNRSGADVMADVHSQSSVDTGANCDNGNSEYLMDSRSDQVNSDKRRHERA